MKLDCSGRRLYVCSECTYLCSWTSGAVQQKSHRCLITVSRRPILKLTSAKAPLIVFMFLTEKALAHNDLSFMATGQKCWITYLRTFILKKFCQVDLSFSFNIVEFSPQVEELWGVFMKNNYLAEWSSLVKTNLSFHMPQRNPRELWFQSFWLFI